MSRRRRWQRRVVRCVGFTTAFAVVLVATVVTLYYRLSDVAPLRDVPLSQMVTIEYSDGSVLTRIGEVDRTEVGLSQVPASVRWAFVAAEDRAFFDEPGFSVRGTVRAAWSDVTGGGTQGGSGITQQLVKNLYVGNAHSLNRKLKELMIAVKLSRSYSKNTILRYYLNTVYFGRGAYGVQAAARAYFHEDVERLTTAQGALLAALVRAPSYYDPAAHQAAARQRWRYVVDSLVATGHLSRAAATALTFPATVRPAAAALGTTGWTHILVGRIFADLLAHGVDQDDVFDLGLTIRTTIDRTAQAAAVGSVEQSMASLTSKQRNLKAAVVAIDPTSGGVLAYYGGTGPSVVSPDGRVDDFDYATNGYRLAGATVEPYVLATVLTQTVEMAAGRPHYTVDSGVDAGPCVVIDRTPVCEPAAQGASSGDTTVSDAMRASSNVVFDQLAAQAGPDEVAALAHRMGVSTSDTAGDPTLVDPNGDTGFGIGSGAYTVSTLDQASGYATLADSGVRNAPYFVQSAVSATGSVVYRHRSRPVRVLDPRVAHDVTLTLGPPAPAPAPCGERPSPIAASTSVDGRDVAVKSATIRLDAAANSDAWTVGYTPHVAAAVWFGSGYDKPVSNRAGAPMTGTDEPAIVWRRFMSSYLRHLPDEPLPRQADVRALPIATVGPETWRVQCVALLP